MRIECRGSCLLCCLVRPSAAVTVVGDGARRPHLCPNSARGDGGGVGQGANSGVLRSRFGCGRGSDSPANEDGDGVDEHHEELALVLISSSAGGPRSVGSGYARPATSWQASGSVRLQLTIRAAALLVLLQHLQPPHRGCPQAPSARRRSRSSAAQYRRHRGRPVWLRPLAGRGQGRGGHRQRLMLGRPVWPPFSMVAATDV